MYFSPQAHRLIYAHSERRKQERDADPERYDRQPTLGEMAKRYPLPESSEVIQQPLPSEDFAALFTDEGIDVLTISSMHAMSSH